MTHEVYERQNKVQNVLLQYSRIFDARGLVSHLGCFCSVLIVGRVAEDCSAYGIVRLCSASWDEHTLLANPRRPCKSLASFYTAVRKMRAALPRERLGSPVQAPFHVYI